MGRRHNAREERVGRQLFLLYLTSRLSHRKIDRAHACLADDAPWHIKSTSRMPTTLPAAKPRVVPPTWPCESSLPAALVGAKRDPTGGGAGDAGGVDGSALPADASAGKHTTATRAAERTRGTQRTP